MKTEELMKEIIEEIDKVKHENVRIQKIKAKMEKAVREMVFITRIGLPKPIGQDYLNYIFPSDFFEEVSHNRYRGILDVGKGEFVRLKEDSIPVVPSVMMRDVTSKSLSEEPEWVMLSFIAPKGEHVLEVKISLDFTLDASAPLFKEIRGLLEEMKRENLGWENVVKFYYLLTIERKIGKERIAKIVEEYFRKRLAELREKVKTQKKIREELAKLISEASEYVV